MSVVHLADRSSDAGLLHGLAAGDSSAAQAFVGRFQARVFGLALSITRDRSLAEEVAQEAFLRAWRSAGRFDAARGTVSTWLLTITHNLAVDAVRRRRTAPVEESALELLVAGVLGAAPDLTARRLDTMDAAERLARLPAEQARAVVLAVIGGCTMAEVAAHEGIPVGTAKTRIRTGLRRLRSAMEADHD